jgi:hypothetical protein
LSDQNDQLARSQDNADGEAEMNLQPGQAPHDMSGVPGGAPRDVPLDEARLRQQAIGVKLRQMFDEVVSEPVPDEFLAILRRADERRSGN